VSSQLSVQARIAGLVDALPAAQRRIAELVVTEPQAVAFGTVRSVAELAGASDPTVVRLAAALGFDGFTALRDAIRAEVSESLHSAAERVRQRPRGRLFERALAVERANVDDTFAGLSESDLDRASGLLADLERRVWLLPSSQMQGLASHLADDLQLCRSAVVLLGGSEFRVRTVLTQLRAGDVVVSFDTQRHEGWLVRTQRDAVARGAVPIALTDRLPCSLDLAGGLALTFSCDTTSPFESQVGLLALGNLLVSGVVERLRPSVTSRIDAVEATWVDGGLFER
jgi:DNA-binding MurR/RpiR family transcriptional regulator